MAKPAKQASGEKAPRLLTLATIGIKALPLFTAPPVREGFEVVVEAR